ncbi:MAG TPA: (Fe-S)-binding protein [Acidimicrobiia bacterium]|nr:(Fe-S)-binding protein [Acidimicrobiia bacterium]
MTAWVTEFRPTRAELSACVQCGLCLPHCPTFRLTGLETASPRGRLAAMSAVAAGVVELDADFEEAMSFCLNCRACEAVCPSLVPYGRAMEGARAEVAAQRPRLGRRVRHFALGSLLPSRRLMALVTFLISLTQRLRFQRLLPARLRSGFDGLRPIKPARPASGMRVAGTLGRVGFLRGCVMDSWFGEVNRAAEELLTRAGYEVISPPNQTCCGALAAHDGAMPEAIRLARKNVEAFRDFDLVVATAAGCSAHLRDYDHFIDGAKLAGDARDVTEVVAGLIEAGHLPRLDRPRGDVAVQDPCHLRHAQRIMAAPRAILTAAGYTPVEIDPDGLCCGAAGIYSLLRPEASTELGHRKADQVRASGSNLVASANPGCELQLRFQLGPTYRIAHPIELYLEALSDPGP